MKKLDRRLNINEYNFAQNVLLDSRVEMLKLLYSGANLRCNIIIGYGFALQDQELVVICCYTFNEAQLYVNFHYNGNIEFIWGETTFSIQDLQPSSVYGAINTLGIS